MKIINEKALHELRAVNCGTSFVHEGVLYMRMDMVPSTAQHIMVVGLDDGGVRTFHNSTRVEIVTAKVVVG